jgi:hypothetical protein
VPLHPLDRQLRDNRAIVIDVLLWLILYPEKGSVSYLTQAYPFSRALLA